MTVITRSIPQALTERVVTPFRIIVPRQLSEEDAKVVYMELAAHPYVRLQDPFFLPSVSSVFPGMFYGTALDLGPIAEALNTIEAAKFDDLEALADAFVECDVPDALEDEAEALDVTDLTGGF